MSYTQWSTPTAAASSSSTPRWSHAETKELVAARAEVDASFMETKRNRLLWDQISSKLLNSGFHRTPDQCKCKWKNLVTRYKGSEAMDPESARQFPFREELRDIFDSRLQRLMSHPSAELEKNIIPARSFSDHDDSSMLGTSHDITQEDAGKRRKRKRKVGRSGNRRSGVVEMLEEFMRRQEKMEAEWCKEEEAREVDRAAREREWREAVVAVERERLEAERRWREAEEQRRSREEARAERRDALISALLHRLLHGNGGGHRP